MSDKSNTVLDLPKTWSADHTSGISGSTRQEKHAKPPATTRDEGLRPEDLDTENDQGAS